MLYFFVFVLAVCWLVYEILLATYSSYLLWDTIVQFSLTIGLFLFWLGLWAFFSKKITHLLRAFFRVEIILWVVGGFSIVILQFLFVYFLNYTEIFVLAYYSLVVFIAVLVGLEIPLIVDLLYTQQEQKYTHSIKELVGDVFTYDYLWALVATILFPFVLLPYVGLLYTALLVGVLNIVTAGLFLMHKQVKREWTKKQYFFAWGVLAVSLLFLLWSFVPVSRYVGNVRDRVFYKDQIIYQQQSDYQHIVVTKKWEKITLYLDGKVQFVSLDEERYHNALWYPAQQFIDATKSDDLSILVLGAGDGLLVRTIFDKAWDQKNIAVDLVELDPAMTSFAMHHDLMKSLNHDALHDKRVSIVHQDAMEYVLEAAQKEKKYDIIIADFPDPRNVSLTKLYSVEFYSLLDTLSKEQSVFVTQASSAFFAKEAFASIQKTIQEWFWRWVVPYHVYIPSFGDWWFVASYRLFDRPHWWRNDENRFGIQRHFDDDYVVEEVHINTLDNHILLQYYLQGWKRFGL